MRATSIVDMSIRTGEATGNIDMKGYTLKVDHIEESTTSHGVVTTSGTSGFGSTPVVLSSGTTNTVWSSAGEVTHSTAGLVIAKMLPIPPWVSRRSVVKIAFDMKNDVGSVSVRFFVMTQHLKKNLVAPVVGQAIDSLPVSEYTGLMEVAAAVSANTSGTWYARTQDVPVKGGELLIIAITNNIGAYASYIKNVVVSCSSSTDTSSLSGFIGGTSG